MRLDRSLNSRPHYYRHCYLFCVQACSVVHDAARKRNMIFLELFNRSSLRETASVSNVGESISIPNT